MHKSTAQDTCIAIRPIVCTLCVHTIAVVSVPTRWAHDMPSNSENHVSTAGNMRNISCPRKEQTTYNDAGEAIRIAEHHCPKTRTRQQPMARESCTTCAPYAHNFANRVPTVWAHCMHCCAHTLCTHMVMVFLWFCLLSLASVPARVFNGQVRSLFHHEF